MTRVTEGRFTSAETCAFTSYDRPWESSHKKTLHSTKAISAQSTCVLSTPFPCYVLSCRIRPSVKVVKKASVDARRVFWGYLNQSVSPNFPISRWKQLCSLGGKRNGACALHACRQMSELPALLCEADARANANVFVDAGRDSSCEQCSREVVMALDRSPSVLSKPSKQIAKFPAPS